MSTATKIVSVVLGRVYSQFVNPDSPADPVERARLTSIGHTVPMPCYRASCYCGAVQYEVAADPVDAKICHCIACQKLHGAPMQWAVIFEKDDVKFTRGDDLLHYYNSEWDQHERILPCKVSCGQCGTLIADEGRNMWLAFPSLFDFKDQKIPESFKPTCHIFYGARIMDVDDGLAKWSGHKDQSTLL